MLSPVDSTIGRLIMFKKQCKNLNMESSMISDYSPNWLSAVLLLRLNHEDWVCIICHILFIHGIGSTTHGHLLWQVLVRKSFLIRCLSSKLYWDTPKFCLSFSFFLFFSFFFLIEMGKNISWYIYMHTHAQTQTLGQETDKSNGALPNLQLRLYVLLIHIINACYCNGWYRLNWTIQVNTDYCFIFNS